MSGHQSPVPNPHSLVPSCYQPAALPVMRRSATPFMMFVYHCHMLFHEDRGMMQNLCLYDPKSGKTPGQQCANPFASMGGAGGGGHGGHVMQ